MSASASLAGTRTLLGHPAGLVILFLTEMWERFSYYGMRSLLILYLTQHFLFSDSRSTLIYGAYTALVYIMAVVGGVLADRYLGARKAVTFGAILLVLGHAGMTLEGDGTRQFLTYRGTVYELATEGRSSDSPHILIGGRADRAPSRDDPAPHAPGRSRIEMQGTRLKIDDPDALGLPASIDLSETSIQEQTQPLYVNLLYLSLALIIAGVGFLKPNISTMVGALYAAGDPRRDAGFTIFYMGINIGALLAALLCGYLGVAYGWSYGFGAAGIGMTLGLVVFLLGRPLLEGKAEPPDPVKLKQRVWFIVDRELLCYLGGLGMIAISMELVIHNQLIGDAVPWVGIGMLAFLAGYACVALERVQRDRMLVAIYVILAQIPFVALYEQIGSSFNLFTDRLVDRSVFGWTIPAPMFQSLDPAFIFLLAPIVAWAWVKLALIGREPSLPVKLALSVCGIGIAFLTLVGGMKLSGPSGLTPVFFVFLVYALNTLTELLLVPVSLSAMTKLAPLQLGGMMMGAWFLYSGMSNYVAGLIAQSTGAKTIGGAIIDVAAAKATYETVYSQTAYVAIGVGVLMLLATPLLKKMLHGLA
jgi:POT family proton-dependent oligopeptide transporter